VNQLGLSFFADNEGWLMSRPPPGLIHPMKFEQQWRTERLEATRTAEANYEGGKANTGLQFPLPKSRGRHDPRKGMQL
jgi:hypothetical protein